MIYKSYLIEQNFRLLVKNIVLFYGENLGLQNEFKNQIKVNNKNAEIINFTQEEILKNENSFYSEILNISLFGQEKIYIINQSSDKILELIQTIETKLDNQKLYFFTEILDRRSKLRAYFEKSKNLAVIACYADNENNLKKIINEKLKGFSGLSAQNINTIMDNCNLDRDKLNNELSKILVFFDDKKLVNDKLEALLNNKINNNFSLLKDNALSGNKISTNKLLSDTVLEPEKNVFYLATINQRLNKLAETDQLAKKTSLEDAINVIKPPIFWKDKPVFLMQAKKWNSNKIKGALNKTYNLEIEIKSNPVVDKSLLMKKLLVDICILANS
jgi:DNA polymerase III subunit delta